MTLTVQPWVTGFPTIALLPYRDSWSHCKEAIRAEVGEAAYDAWFGGIAFVEVKSWVLRLSVPTRFLKRWIDAHYRAALLQACRSEWPAVTHIEVGVRTCVVRDMRTQPVLLLPAPQPMHKQRPEWWSRYYPFGPSKLFPNHPGMRSVHAEVRVKIEDVQRVVARHYNVSRDDLLSSRRTADVVWPRQVAVYLARVLTLRSFPDIGHYFGGRDHSTVLHAYRKIEALVGADTALAEEIEYLKGLLQQAA